MKKLLILIVLLNVSVSLAKTIKKKVTRQTTSMSMDAHEVQGVDKGRLNLLPDVQPLDSSRLDAIDAGEADWMEKAHQAQEDLCRW